MTLCVVCVILGMLLATMFKQVCGCKNIEGMGEYCGGAMRALQTEGAVAEGWRPPSFCPVPQECYDSNGVSFEPGNNPGKTGTCADPPR